MRKSFFIKLTLLAILVSLILTGLNSCKSNIDEPTKECSKKDGVFLPEDAANRFVFDSLSYWVYSNAPLGLDIDTILSVSSFHDTIQVHTEFERTSRCYELKEMVIKSKSSLLNYKVYVGPVIDAIDAKDEFKPYGDILFQLEFAVNSTGIVSDQLFLKGNKYFTPSTTNIELIDSVEINDQMYYDILKLNVEKQGYEFFKEALWSKNIGLVQYTDYNDRKWKLTSYKLSQ